MATKEQTPLTVIDGGRARVPFSRFSWLGGGKDAAREERMGNSDDFLVSEEALQNFNRNPIPLSSEDIDFFFGEFPERK
ncbi:MAG: hypothetical protein V4437_03535 [Patescibacteria group bacterium]